MSPLYYRIIFLFGAALVATGILVAALRHASGSISDEWFKLVVELQKQERCLYGPDRAFLREMINLLSIDEAAMPSASQRRWILSLKKECKL
jgi:hypothetical protein